MLITDPYDQNFRDACREIDAPDWWPQDAPVHTVEGVNVDGTCLFLCNECSWEMRITPGEGIVYYNDGDKWVRHPHGSTVDGFNIGNLQTGQYSLADSLFEFLKNG